MLVAGVDIFCERCEKRARRQSFLEEGGRVAQEKEGEWATAITSSNARGRGCGYERRGREI